MSGTPPNCISGSLIERGIDMPGLGHQSIAQDVKGQGELAYSTLHCLHWLHLICRAFRPNNTTG